MTITRYYGLFYEPDFEILNLLNVNDSKNRLVRMGTLTVDELLRFELNKFIKSDFLEVILPKPYEDELTRLFADNNTIILDCDSNYVFSVDDGIGLFKTNRINAEIALKVNLEAQRYIEQVRHYGIFPDELYKKLMCFINISAIGGCNDPI